MEKDEVLSEIVNNAKVLMGYKTIKDNYSEFYKAIDFIENELDSRFTFYNKLHIGCCDCGKSYMFEDNKGNIHHNIKTNYITKNDFVKCI